MSEEQFAALLAKLKDDAELQEKLKGAADLDAAVALAKEAGFDVSKADWLRYQAKQIIELSDDELEGVSGGGDFWWQYRSPPLVLDKTERFPSFKKPLEASLTHKPLQPQGFLNSSIAPQTP